MKLQKLYRYVRQACDTYRLIEPGDHIAAAVSGGKDSLALLYALAGLRSFYPVPFTLSAVTIDLGYSMDYSPIEELCRALDVPFYLEKTQIREIVLGQNQEKHPCSLCANLRRGALVDAALRIGCSKIALGHHRDDIIDTLMMSLLYEGRFYSVSPYTDYPDSKIAVIRPLIYASEGEIRSFAEERKCPVVKNLCPADGHSARSEMNQLISELAVKYPDIRKKLFHAVEHGRIPDWEDAGKRYFPE